MTLIFSAVESRCSNGWVIRFIEIVSSAFMNHEFRRLSAWCDGADTAQYNVVADVVAATSKMPSFALRSKQHQFTWCMMHDSCVPHNNPIFHECRESHPNPK